MTRLYMALALLAGIPFLLHAQNATTSFWEDATEKSIPVSQNMDVYLPLKQYRTFRIRQQLMLEITQQAKSIAWLQQPNATSIVYLPMPDGTKAGYYIFDDPVLAPDLAARYPSIRSYKAIAIEPNGGSGRFDVSPYGLHGMLQTPKGEVWLEPYAKPVEGTIVSNFPEHYISYYAKDVYTNAVQGSKLACGTQDVALPLETETKKQENILAPKEKSSHAADPIGMRTYRLALAATHTYSKAKGGTKESVLASFNTVVNTINQIYETELAIRFQLIPDTDKLIFLSDTADKFTSQNDAVVLVEQNSNVITQLVKIPGTAFDIAQVFTGACINGIAGIGPGKVCTSTKAGGVTCHYSNNLQLIAIRVMAHEIAHQFAVSHSWHNCPQNQDQRSGGAAYEPGSGSTIMSYAGTCGDQNIQADSDGYFHVKSLEQFKTYISFQIGSCVTAVPTGNTAPLINMPYENGFYIPRSTPFALKATATDAENTNLTYCWEQYNLEPAITSIFTPSGRAPIFRSFPPVSSPERYFPALPTLLNNTNDPTETLPAYGRDLSFRLTVRDNNRNGGGTDWKQVDFKVADNAGPFVITSPNTIWTGGTKQEVSWNVANTDKSPVNTRLVNILLSQDGGFTYPDTLAKNVLNNGLATVVSPNLNTNKARVKVEAVGNIYFDISNSNFTIQQAALPGFALQALESSGEICTPFTKVVSIEALGFQGFQEEVTLAVETSLPAGVTASFASTKLQPGQKTTLTFVISNSVSSAFLPVTVKGTTTSGSTFTLPLTYRLIINNFADISLQTPANGVSNINQTTPFNWTDGANASTYDLQVSSSPTFLAPLINKTKLSVSEFNDAGIRLQDNTLYFWRIRPSNDCGNSDWLTPAAFHTSAVVCNTYNAGGLPINISGSGRPTIEVPLVVAEDGIISDVNIPIIRARYDAVNALKVTLISPVGTEVVLYDRSCTNIVNRFETGFDDESPALVCPPDDAVTAKPVQPLSVLKGQSTKGTWKLRIQVVAAGGGGGGSISEFKLQFCATLSPKPPVLVTNIALPALPNATQAITNQFLRVVDTDNTPAQLTYTIISTPRKGLLRLINQNLFVGNTFTQEQIDNGDLKYVASLAGGDDSFAFVVQDGNSGFVPVSIFQINLPSSTRDVVKSQAFQVFPNPSTGLINWILPQNWKKQPIRGELITLQGQVVFTFDASHGDSGMTLPASVPSGVYIIRLQTNEAIGFAKVQVSR